jgi:hypothetical protein
MTVFGANVPEGARLKGFVRHPAMRLREQLAYFADSGLLFACGNLRKAATGQAFHTCDDYAVLPSHGGLRLRVHL